MSDSEIDDNPADYTTRLHRSLTRYDRGLLLQCDRNAVLDTWFIAIFAAWILLLKVSWVMALGCIIIAVLRTKYLRTLGKVPYGYQIMQRLRKEQGVYYRGGRAFRRWLRWERV